MEICCSLFLLLGIIHLFLLILFDIWNYFVIFVLLHEKHITRENVFCITNLTKPSAS